jgi:hypothetical protein
LSVVPTAFCIWFVRVSCELIRTGLGAREKAATRLAWTTLPDAVAT